MSDVTVAKNKSILAVYSQLILPIIRFCENIGWRYINNRSDAQRLYISAKKPFSNLFFANGVVTFVVVMKCESKF